VEVDVTAVATMSTLIIDVRISVELHWRYFREGFAGMTAQVA